MFVACTPRDFDEDRVVVYHELGHALAWFVLGGAVGRIRFSRESNGVLTARVRLHARDAGEGPDDTVRKMPGQVALRILAGEAAARRLLGLSRREICSYGRRIRGVSDLASVISGQENDQSDVSKLLEVAFIRGIADWNGWIAARLADAYDILDLHWSAIEGVAGAIAPRLPDRAGSSHVTSGLQLIGGFEKHGVNSMITPHVEVVCRGAEGPFGLRVSRWWRSHVTQTLHAWPDRWEA